MKIIVKNSHYMTWIRFLRMSNPDPEIFVDYRPFFEVGPPGQPVREALVGDDLQDLIQARRTYRTQVYWYRKEGFFL